jgi:hypothetical protein
MFEHIQFPPGFITLRNASNPPSGLGIEQKMYELNTIFQPVTEFGKKILIPGNVFFIEIRIFSTSCQVTIN